MEDLKTRRRDKNIPQTIPFDFNYDVDELKSNCENLVGYIPIPLGVAGPIPIDGNSNIHVPLCTTEGALVASVNRGCKLLRLAGGVNTVLSSDGTTRGPVINFGDIQQAHEFSKWCESTDGFSFLKHAFESTSRYGKLTQVKPRQAGKQVFVRFKAHTGEAMGMNMVSKGTLEAISKALEEHFPNGKLVSLSGNYCTDKRASAMNWIEGRGKSVIAAAVIRKDLIMQILHVPASDLLQVYTQKCLIGSTMSMCIGGANAHAANIVAAIFIATGQDPAQVIDSSYCLTLLEEIDDEHIHASVTMPCVQVGSIGGGTQLPPQKAAADMLIGNYLEEESRAERLARNIAAAVLAGELSLLGALAEGSLVRAHMALNRK